MNIYLTLFVILLFLLLPFKKHKTFSQLINRLILFVVNRHISDIHYAVNTSSYHMINREEHPTSCSSNKVVQGQHPANFSHCIFEQIDLMIIYPRRKNCSQHWYWKINVVAVLWLSIKSIVFYQTYRDDQTKGIRIK